MIPRLNTAEKQAKLGFWRGERSESLSGGFRGRSPLRKVLGFKIDLNAAEIITVQDYKRTKINVNGSTHIQC